MRAGTPDILAMRKTLAALLTLMVFPAAAQPVRATYEVYAAGMTVLQLEAVFDVAEQGYRVETRLRTRGMAAAIVPGEQVSRTEGRWEGALALPATYTSEGTWRGRVRRVALEWQARNPRIAALTPPNEDEREPVTEAQRRGTMDALSALAQLARTVRDTNRCEGAAAVFDGRRRSDYTATSQGIEAIAPWRGGAWAGQALRCAFEGRQVAGFQRDQARDQAAPQTGTAWIVSPYAGAPPIPVRIEIPSRWFGSATAVLLRAEPSGQ
jgi:hypothetical protein